MRNHSIRWLFCTCLVLWTHYVVSAKSYKDRFINYPSWAFYLYQHPGYKNYKPPVDIRKNGCKWGTWVTFPQKIEAIQAKVGDWTNPANLWLSKDFLAMYKHPHYYHDAIVSYMADPAYTLDQKTIALYVDQPSIQEAWQLYKEKKIDIHLLTLICALRFSRRVEPKGDIKKHTETLYWRDEKPILEQMLEDLPKHTPLRKALGQVLQNVFPKMWRKYLNIRPRSSYYDQRAALPFRSILSSSFIEKKQFENWLDEDKPESREYLLGPEYPPYFLIVLDHPSDYYPIHFGPFSGSDYNGWGVRNGIGALQDPDISDEEKSLAIFGMSRLNGTYYAELILYAYEWYKQGLLTAQHLHQLFVCDFPTFYKYPFFILDYKNEYVQVALDELISLPMIPCGLREIAKKVKEGKLATKEEMDYMEGYRTFRKTYFTLYESIPSSK